MVAWPEHKVFLDVSTLAWTWLYPLTCNLTQRTLEGLSTLSANRHISRKPRQKVTSKQTCVTFAEQVSLTGRWKWSILSARAQIVKRERFSHILSNCWSCFKNQFGGIWRWGCRLKPTEHPSPHSLEPQCPWKRTCPIWRCEGSLWGDKNTIIPSSGDYVSSECNALP